MTVQRTGASRHAEWRCGGPGWLAPVADLCVRPLDHAVKRFVKVFAVSMVALVALYACFLWAIEWSGRILAPVQPRMPMSQVQSLVGVPRRISTNNEGFVTWSYTHWWSYDANVFFDTNGVVYGIETD